MRMLEDSFSLKADHIIVQNFVFIKLKNTKQNKKKQKNMDLWGLEFHLFINVLPAG